MTVTKTIDLSGTSSGSIEAAVEHALARASATIADIEGFEIERITGTVGPDGIEGYRVWLKVTFVVQEKLHE
ncbi:MAG TPA: dodecin family protein [Actinomycetota bacterium]|nr:dodecin family protein [Actinomycetota bacterium]